MSNIFLKVSSLPMLICSRDEVGCKPYYSKQHKVGYTDILGSPRKGAAVPRKHTCLNMISNY